jgi:preprotein translocase subunit Sss1
MELDPKQVPIIVAIGAGICVGLVGYLAYVLFSIIATA